MIYEKLYKKLDELGAIDAIKRNDVYIKSQSEPFMELVFEIYNQGVEVTSDGNEYKFTDIWLAHYWVQNSDLMSDPLMMVRVWHYEETPMAEALSFRQDGVPSVMSYSYQMIDGEKYIDTRAKKENNDFLLIWLNNLIQQGHTLKEDIEDKQDRLRAEAVSEEEYDREMGYT